MDLVNLVYFYCMSAAEFTRVIPSARGGGIYYYYENFPFRVTFLERNVNILFQFASHREISDLGHKKSNASQSTWSRIALMGVWMLKYTGRPILIAEMPTQTGSWGV